MKLSSGGKTVCLLVLVVALAACCAADVKEPAKAPAAAAPVTSKAERDAAAGQCVDMIFPKQTPDLLKAALIKTSEGNTVVAKLMRHAGSSNAGLQNMDSEGRHHHKGYGDHRGKYEHHKNKYYGDHDDDHKDDSHEDEPGIGAEFQTRGFVLAVKDFPVSPTMNEDVGAAYGNLYANGAFYATDSPFGVIGTRTLLFKPVDGKTFLTVDQANLPDLKRRMSARYPSVKWDPTFVPAGYTMFGQLTDAFPPVRQNINSPPTRTLPDFLGQALTIVGGLFQLPLDIYAAIGAVPKGAQTGLNPQVCLMDIPCVPGSLSFPYPSQLLSGTVSMTLVSSDEPALKGSIPINRLNNNDWIPKGTVKVECKLNLSDEVIMDLAQCQSPFAPPVKKAAGKQA